MSADVRADTNPIHHVTNTHALALHLTNQVAGISARTYQTSVKQHLASTNLGIETIYGPSRDTT